MYQYLKAKLQVNDINKTIVVYGLATQISDVIGHGCTQTCLAIKQQGGYSGPYYFGQLYATKDLAEKNKGICEIVVELEISYS